MQGVVARRLNRMRRAAAQVQRVTGLHGQFGLQRPHLRRRHFAAADAARRLALVDAPFLAAGELDHQDIVGIKVASIGLVGLLRKKRDCIGKHAFVRRVDGAAHGVDAGVENVQAFKHQGGAMRQIFLDNRFVEELYFSGLDHLVRQGPRAVDLIALPKEGKPAGHEQRVVELLLQMLQGKEGGPVDQARRMRHRLPGRQLEGGFVIKIAQLAQLRGEFHGLGFKHNKTGQRPMSQNPIKPEKPIKNGGRSPRFPVRSWCKPD